MAVLPKTNAERAAARRAKDARKSIVQINVRVPLAYDVAIKMLAEYLRKGELLQGFVLRDARTGRVHTLPV